MASAMSVPGAVARGAAPRPRARDSRNRPCFGVTREFVAIGGRDRLRSISARGSPPRARIVNVRASAADPRGGIAPSVGFVPVPTASAGGAFASRGRRGRSSRFVPRAGGGGEGDLVATFGRYVGAALGVVGLSFVAGTLAAERTEDEDVPRMGERAAEPSTPKRSQKQTVAGGVAGANNAAKKRKPAPPGVLPSKPTTLNEGDDVLKAKMFSFGNMKKAASMNSGASTTAPKYDWGAAEADGPREYMEDAWFVNERGFADGYFFAGVADGHGGRASSAFLRERLFDSLNTYVGGVSGSGGATLTPGDAPDGTPGGGYLADALDRGFVATDAKLIDHVASLGEPECWSGSTCTVALVREDRVVCANVGDSRALLVRTGRGATKGIELSSDHRPVGSCKTGRQELDRVVRAGGWSVGGRVCGILAVSRAFGDYEFKGGRFDLLEDLSEEPLAKKATLDSPPVIANPAVFECARSAEDEWLVLASDGLWDTVNSAQCATFIKQETKKKPDMNADELANALVKRALRFRTQDNVAVVVVDLRSAT